MPNSNHASPGIKPLCSKIDVNKNSYHIETNQLTCIADQWTDLQWHDFYCNEFLNKKLQKEAFTLDKGHKLVAQKTFRRYPQCLEHLNILCTFRLSHVSTGLWKSSVKGLSEHTLIQTKYFDNCRIIEKLKFVFER